MRPFCIFLVVLAALLVCNPAWCVETPEQDDQSTEALLNTMTFQKGVVELSNGNAVLDVPDSFRFIGPEDGKRFLEEGWGNPDGTGQIGILLPKDTDLFGDAAWAVVISYQEDGYVSDKDASKIDYDKLLKEIQATTQKSNEQRVEMGFDRVTLVGWAAAPHYDSQSKKLYWAKELKFEQNEDNTLNYNVRILGRKGVLVMNAVSSMKQLPMVQERMEEVIAFANFKDGYRYSDFNPGVDKMAAYGIAALIGGKVAAKAGLLAKLGGLLVALKKVIIVAFMAVIGLFAKLFKRRKATTPA